MQQEKMMIDPTTLAKLEEYQLIAIKNEGGRAISNEWYRTGAYGKMEYYAGRTYNGLTLYVDFDTAIETVTHHFHE